MHKELHYPKSANRNGFRQISASEKSQAPTKIGFRDNSAPDRTRIPRLLGIQVYKRRNSQAHKYSEGGALRQNPSPTHQVEVKLV